MTTAQRRALALLASEETVTPRRLAGEYGLRTQDAGRTLAALERAGLVYFHIGDGRSPQTASGYRLR